MVFIAPIILIREIIKAFAMPAIDKPAETASKEMTFTEYFGVTPEEIEEQLKEIAGTVPRQSNNIPPAIQDIFDKLEREKPPELFAVMYAADGAAGYDIGLDENMRIYMADYTNFTEVPEWKLIGIG